MTTNPALYELAHSQHGAFTRAQARALGVGRKDLARGVRTGQLVAPTAQVLAFTAAPRTLRQEVMLAVLDAGSGAGASHPTSLALFGIPGFDLLPAHVLTSRRHRGVGARNSVLHTTRWLRPNHLTVLDGIPVTTPTRALFDLSSTLHPLRLERALDAVWARGLTSHDLLCAHLDDLARRGRGRITVMRALIDARSSDHRPPESGVESRFDQLMHEAGIFTLERQVDVGDELRWLGRSDFRDTRVPLVVQIDGSLHHQALIDRRIDDQQTAQLIAAGFEVLRIDGDLVWRNPQEAVRRVRVARGEAALRRPAAV